MIIMTFFIACVWARPLQSLFLHPNDAKSFDINVSLDTKTNLESSFEGNADETIEYPDRDEDITYPRCRLVRQVWLDRLEGDEINLLQSCWRT